MKSQSSRGKVTGPSKRYAVRKQIENISSEELAIRAGEAELKALIQSFSIADSDMKDRFFDLVQAHKAQCTDLHDRRASLIRKISSAFPRAGKVLEANTQYLIMVPKCGVFTKDGIIMSYMPDRDSEDDQTVNPADPSASQEPITFKQSPSYPGRELAQQDSDLSQGETPNSIGAIHEDPSRAHITSITTSAPEPFLERVNDMDASSQVSTRRYSMRHNHTTQQPITMGMAKKRSYWIFEYRFRDEVALYVMRCPSKLCQNPVFSRHPLKQNRAAIHLKTCGQNFRSEKEMVKRYARLVVPDRTGRHVIWAAARKHNCSLISEDERHIEEENLVA